MGWLVGSLLLCGACNQDWAEVNVTEPWPVGKPDLPAFPARQQGRYFAPNDTTEQVELGPQALVHTWWQSRGWQHRPALDSLRRQPAGRWHLGPERGDSAQVLEWHTETVFSLTDPGSRLRHQGRYFYLNTPGTSPDTWAVQRLRVKRDRLTLSSVTSDTARLSSLAELHVLQADPHQRHRPRRYLLQARTVRQSRQVLRHEELWEAVYDAYQRR